MSESLQAEERRLLQQVPAVSVHAKISGVHARSFAAAKSMRCDASANTEPAAMESDGCVTAALAEIEVQRKQLAAKELEIDRYSRQIEQLSEHVAYVNEMLNAREAKLLDFEEQLNGREAVLRYRCPVVACLNGCEAEEKDPSKIRSKEAYLHLTQICSQRELGTNGFEDRSNLA